MSARKIIIAVHGIGDQVRNATIQGVVAQFSRHYGREVCVPLGHFDAGLVTMELGGGTTQRQSFGFAEAYWANIPRDAAKDEYTLEETKQWATGVVDRLAGRPSAQTLGVSYPLVRRVIEEMVETIGLLESMTFVAAKTGVGKFDLNKILTDYVNDVQVVAEFERLRNQIIERFQSVMEKLNTADDEFYIVAHSEGTVVSFLALLQAMWQPKPPKWLGQVRGFMTIGSPIDKHIVLWEELFHLPKPCPYPLEKQIRWRNYYDFGDPVGFKLDIARDWLMTNGVRAFEFEAPPTQRGEPDPHHDNGFARYFLPGKAHNDYWRDPDVFDHFIKTVVENTKDPAAPPPKSKPLVWPVTYLASYGIALLLLIAGVYVVERAVLNFHRMNVLTGQLLGDVTGIAFLIAGLTILARIPRLVSPRQPDSKKWPWLAGLIFLACGALYWGCAAAGIRTALGALPKYLIGQAGVDDPSAQVLTLATIGLAGVLGIVVALVSRWEPRAGMKPLLLWGGGTATIMIFLLLKDMDPPTPPVWSVAIAIAVFLSLWWLAALMFDLIFVWHRYIRHEAGPKRLERIYRNAASMSARSPTSRVISQASGFSTRSETGTPAPTE